MEFAENMDAAWSQYNRLEERLIQYFNFVPPVEAHYNVWSNELAEILILAGTGIDSFLQAGISCTEFDNFKPVEDARTKILDPNLRTNIADFRIVYEDFYALSEQPVYLLKTEFSAMGSRGVEPVFIRLKPFSDWAQTNGYPLGQSPFRGPCHSHLFLRPVRG